MAAPAIRVTINRDHFRQLVNGSEVVFHAPGGRILVTLNLESGSSEFGKYTDPPEAAEYYHNMPNNVRGGEK